MALIKERKLYQIKIINGGDNHVGKYLYDFINSYYEDGKLIKQEITQGDIDEVDKLQINKFLADINSNQIKKISDVNNEKIKLQDELKVYKDIAQKEVSEKMILQTELLIAKESLKAHEENFKIAKSINDEIYAENKKLKESNERIVKDMVKLDENIVTLNAQIAASKKGK